MKQVQPKKRHHKNAITQLLSGPRTPSINKNPLSSHALDINANRNNQNTFLSGYAQKIGPSTEPTKPNDNQPKQVEDNPLRYVFRTPPSRNLDLVPKQIDTPNYTPNSRASVGTAPDSTVTKITKESQAAREDFRNSLSR